MIRPIAVTGANGFVGRALCHRLANAGCAVRALVRRPTDDLAADVRIVGDLTEPGDWMPFLEGCDAIVHLAARVHVMRETAVDPLAEFRRANTAVTEQLAEAAVGAGVRRFVLVSTAKVNGESTSGRAFRETDAPAPQDAYALSKWEAEQALWRVAANSGLEAVVVRPPLVYGPGVGGNFLRLLEWVRRGLPLPLASVRNRRSLVYVENLTDALVACAVHPAAAGKTFLATDDDVFSTPELIRELAHAIGRPAPLMPCPAALLQAGAKLMGRSAEAERLTGSLELDAGALHRELGWRPPFTAREGLAATVQWYLKEQTRV